MTTRSKNIITHVGIILLMLVISCIYFAPALQGKIIPQGDIQKYESMAKAQMDYHQQTGEYSNWCSTMFSGMPGYQIIEEPQHSIFTPFKDFFFGFFSDNLNGIGILFLYLLGFYVALIALGVNVWLALFGALAFALGSYNIIIIEAGHLTKAYAIALMAPIWAGIILALKGKRIWGGILFCLALGLQITFNHIQITYYTAIGGAFIGLVYLIYAIKDKAIKSFVMGASVLLLGIVFAIGCNAAHLFVNQEYLQYTMRGGNAITVAPEQLYHDGSSKSNHVETDGLDINYAYNWSYGIGETYTLLVPGAMGGGSTEPVGKESAYYQLFSNEQAPLYWGDQLFTSGPVYFGALIVFLFFFGLGVVKGPDRWWLLLATVFAVLMSWGKNLLGLNEFLLHNLPLYNKFRTPSMSLVIANVAMVLMAVLAIKNIIETKKTGNHTDIKRINLVLLISSGATVLTILIIMVASSSFSFSGSADEEMARQYANQWPMIQDVFIKDRKALFNSDSWRSIFIIVMGTVVLWLYVNNKIKKAGIVIGLLLAITLFDLWNVDRRYLNKDSFVSANKLKMSPDPYDLEIDQQAAQHGDAYYRVYNMAVNTFNDSKPAAYHNLIGGYCAAKLRRYQDLIDFYLADNRIGAYYNKRLPLYATNANPNWTPWDSIPVLDMLNARYVVWKTSHGLKVARRNTALGNAWFVREAKIVADANEEILALNNFDPATTAIIDQQWKSILGDWHYLPDSSATIQYEHQQIQNPSYVKYNTSSKVDQLAVFSEIFYAPDWKCYIDGKPTDYIQANYVLRAVVVPAGNHIIEFKNESPTWHKLNTVNLICSIVLCILIVASLAVSCRKKRMK